MRLRIVLCDLCETFAHFAVKSFDRKGREGQDRKETLGLRRGHIAADNIDS
jgi:hypothetical protein